jgi:hypothetical protein
MEDRITVFTGTSGSHVAKAGMMVAKQAGLPQRDTTVPWRLRMGIFWKVPFITFSKCTPCKVNRRNIISDFFRLGVKIGMEFVFLEDL